MKRFLVLLAAFASLTPVSALAENCDAVALATNAGETAGLADWCGLPKIELFSSRAGTVVKLCAKNDQERVLATARFADAMLAARKRGPYPKTCDQIENRFLANWRYLQTVSKRAEGN